MRERDRGEERTPSVVAGSGGGSPDDLRCDAERLLAAGNDLIDRALSQDSTAFLEANRQEGGQ